MPELNEKITKLELGGILVEQFLNQNFLSELKKEGLVIKPAAIVLLAEKELKLTEPAEKTKSTEPPKEPKKINFPIILEHNSDDDYKNKIMKFSCEDPESFEKVRAAIKKMV